MELIMTRGAPGSGKSTWAQAQQGFFVIEKDAIRKELESRGWVWSRENEKDVLKIQTDLILKYLRDGRNVIAADTGFGKHEARLRGLATQCGAEFSVRDFTDVPLEVCLQRNEGRKDKEGYVPPEVIKDMYSKYVEPQLKPIHVEWVDGLPTAVLCDLDGTLAIHDGRSPYDTAKCETDLLNKNVAIVLSALEDDGRAIIFVSGREDKFRPETERWLGTHGYSGFTLLMRKAGDTRNDAIVKNEIFDAEIRGKYNVVCVLDDRDRVVKRWRELGLTCLQVNYGDF